MAARGLIGSLLKDLNVSRGKCCLDYGPREEKRDREEGGGGGGGREEEEEEENGKGTVKLSSSVCLLSVKGRLL